MRHLSLISIIFSILLISCKKDKAQNPNLPNTPPTESTLVEAFPKLQFTNPVEMSIAPDESNRIFVVLQDGQIEVFPNQSDVSSKTTFLNLGTRLVSGGETGLLGLAFHPNYKNNGYFYVNYTRQNPNLETVISRFQVSSQNLNEANLDSEQILLTFSQPYSNHNGGSLRFGKDGYLYIAVGDGGSGGDPQNNAQNRANLLGKILRIDVDNPQENLKYGIPTSNPYKNNTQSFREEIFAYGLRNPWKITVDRETGAIWAADVGQNAVEEINIIENGKNYGWRIKEANNCYNPSSNCNSEGLTAPVFQYSQSNGDRSITGGYVYRGLLRPTWQGKYIYGDYISGRIWLLTYSNQNTQNELLWDTEANISSFGEDQAGEIYVLYYGRTGKIMEIK